MRNQKLFGDETGKRWPFLPSFCEIMQVFYAIDNDARLFFLFLAEKNANDAHVLGWTLDEF